MKKQINEFKRMQLIAGLITESEYRESQMNEAKETISVSDAKEYADSWDDDDILMDFKKTFSGKDQIAKSDFINFFKKHIDDMSEMSDIRSAWDQLLSGEGLYEAEKMDEAEMDEVKESPKNEAADYSKVDSILKGTYKKPVAKVDPEIKKMANILDTLVSKPFGYEKLEDILNALGPIEPTDLDKAIDMMKTSVFELNGGDPFYNLIVHSSKYTDKGVALSWEDDHWRAG